MDENRKTEEYRPFRSVTRLLIGGVLLGSELLDNQLRKWDGHDEEADLVDVSVIQDDPLPDTLPAPQVGKSLKSSQSDLRYALIGLIFEGEEKLEEALETTKRLGSSVNSVFDPVLRPVKKIGTSRPVREGIDQLASRGQSAVERWISRGREEETNSRALTQQATSSTIDQSILYMAENEAITELIQTQGVSLAEQILGLIRAITFSADYFFEGLVRYVLRQKPRYLLPPPSSDVQEQASWALQDYRQEEL